MAQNDISDQQQNIPNKRSNNHDIWYSGANLIFQEEFFKVFETFLFHHLQQAKKGQKVAQNYIYYVTINVYPAKGMLHFGDLYSILPKKCMIQQTKP